MPKHFKLNKKYILLLCIPLSLVIAALLVCFYMFALQERRNDYARISTEEYDTVFLSMFPTDTYSEEDFVYYLAANTLKTSYNIPNIRILQSYIKKIAESGNTISTVYLGVRPEKLSADKLLALLREYPSINYHVILAHPSMDYWTELSDSKRLKTLEKYREVTDILLSESNVTVYSFSREWLICNPANYRDTFLTNEDISRTLLLHCNKLCEYFITTDNVDSVFAEFSNLLERECTAPTAYPDLSGYKVVLFGDSVIGNYTDSSSIPGVVAGLTGATVYNCGYGGNSASFFPEAPVNLPGIVDSFIKKDTSLLPTDKPVYSGITEYIQDSSAADKLCFVINYGLNDYFIGAPVSTEDPYDVNSYCGAFRTAIEALQKAYPEAQIILMAPNFTSYFNNGEDLMSEVGGVLTDYVNAIIALGAEYNVDVLDNYSDLGINANNHGSYLLDGCHPNQRTRFTMGSRIAFAIR